ncbi:hypothetical protein D9V32_05885 [Mycetocola tolaasinivorans]|uniref:DUF3592 domain-containing protein n=1 Tax=Mycetocola tolaasinivorans TaxID=76635 RepID=A0A3L7A966_9MICO|nr:hypothetical protein [Mycetocola tolaasinivorans]RLP76398.1 hypothetical protein D9V32_05885 [Mycetocola tolaasinivorans]
MSEQEPGPGSGAKTREQKQKRAWLGTAARVGQIAGHSIFFLVMGVVTLVAVVLGIGGIVSAQEPQLWGTFTQTSQECMKAVPESRCSNFGNWVSDDGSTTLTDVRLDGTVNEGGTARTSYRPGGFNNDEDNNIVHVEWTSSGFIWFPWILVILSVGSCLYYAKKWKRRTRPTGKIGRHAAQS